MRLSVSLWSLEMSVAEVGMALFVETLYRTLNATPHNQTSTDPSAGDPVPSGPQR